MSQAPTGVNDYELNEAARRVLLDALTALKDHLDALTIVGAQAVYLRTQGARLRSAAYTSDGDISIDPALLGEEPLLEEAMRAAGFRYKAENQSGLWERPEQVGDQTVPVEVDLLVPHLLAPRPNTKRRTELPPHDGWATRKAAGLEVAAVDRSIMTVTSLTPGDPRSIDVHVAGPAALLVAKAYKLHERIVAADKKPTRLQNKDAGDVYRIMTTVPAAQVAASLSALCRDARVGTTATEGLEFLQRLFGTPTARGTALAVEALAGDIPDRTIRAYAPHYISQLTI